MSSKRNYSSEARRRAKADTRSGIIRAVIDVILEEGAHAFTMQNVAARAGVSLRTVYRHFATREHLLEGLSEHLDETMSALGFAAPADAGEFAAAALPLYRRFDAMRDALRASVVASIATGYRSQGHVQRWSDVSETLAAAYPGLGREALREATAIIGTLTGSRTWYVLSCELGLNAEQGGRAVEWALSVLLEELNQRSRAVTHR